VQDVEHTGQLAGPIGARATAFSTFDEAREGSGARSALPVACARPEASRSRHALVVEHNQGLAETLASFLSERLQVVHVAGGMRDAEKHLRAAHFDTAIIDLLLPDGSGVELIERLWRQPIMPQVIVVGNPATPELAFRLGQAGVRACLPEPVTREVLQRTWDALMATVPDIRPLVRASVGRVGLHQLEQIVRTTMIDEALARAGRRRNRAARLLGISRQLLQHILRGK
jgi:DNA-binding NtrC family response regulator